MPDILINPTGHAVIDVGKGRKKLAKAIADGRKFDVIIQLTIDSQNSRDDGVSIEFSGGNAKVMSVTEWVKLTYSQIG